MSNLFYIKLRELDYGHWVKLTKLYLSNPVDHCYLMNGLLYSPESVDGVFLIENGGIKGYVYKSATRRGSRIVLWGKTTADLLATVLNNDSFIVMSFQMDVSEVELEPYLDVLKERGFDSIETAFFYDMVVDETGFKPFETLGVRRLVEKDVDAFVELRKTQGRAMSRDDAYEMVRSGRFYGIFDNDKLVGVAGTRVRLPEVWIIGHVFVHPDYRGRGFGKAVTSAVTKDAVSSGATAYLQVEVDNHAAINVYERLGYRVLRKNPWIFVEKTTISS